ncbi:hypothetical protein M9M90_17445 [Phenylobacterium sp. LH3H17]|uniref:hypothetical protein n=1 Tax=Phenylobacterium sp. LH3H17 TaxID=2903901 RepID=UPI0020C946B1|nr:hypothetical protein [Phenylobacterium sp. LH3H17]UTP38987.1 hypothetical protein M9M90_17445 [Phenylobacterium sp. LH3H17]
MYPQAQSRPFFASRLKIGRAARHVAALRGEIAAYQARVPIYMDCYIDENDPQYMAWSINIAEAVPYEWAPIIGDIVHNLRASLDLLACEAVRLNGNSGEGVYFPFAKSESEMEAMIVRRMPGASPEAYDLVRRFQPYTGGNGALRGVHDLDIIDKHQTLLPVAGEISHATGGIGLEDITTRVGRPAQGTALIEAYAMHGLMAGITPAKFALVFPRGGPFAGLQMVPTLEDLIQDFSRVVDAFETLYLGRVLQENATI